MPFPHLKILTSGGSLHLAMGCWGLWVLHASSSLLAIGAQCSSRTASRRPASKESKVLETRIDGSEGRRSTAERTRRQKELGHCSTTSRITDRSPGTDEKVIAKSIVHALAMTCTRLEKESSRIIRLVRTPVDYCSCSTTASYRGTHLLWSSPAHQSKSGIILCPHRSL